jgi:hypothetical protein
MGRRKRPGGVVAVAVITGVVAEAEPRAVAVGKVAEVVRVIASVTVSVSVNVSVLVLVLVVVVGFGVGVGVGADSSNVSVAVNVTINAPVAAMVDDAVAILVILFVLFFRTK